MSFVDGNIVWVKLGSLWWPGEVYAEEHIPEELRKAKKPIAYVKFFQNHKVLCVYNKSRIRMYHSKRKMEYLQRGMDLVREGSNKNIDCFPFDVAMAEFRSSGDPDIIFRSEFGYTGSKPDVGPATSIASPESSLEASTSTTA